MLVANLTKPRVKPAVDELIPWLESRVKLVGLDHDRTVDLSQVEADAILVLGGDGTLISVARRLKGRRVPVMGVNYGRLGFLASFTPSELPRYFDPFIRGELRQSERSLLDVVVVGPDVKPELQAFEAACHNARFRSVALNDAVITAGAPFRMIDIELGIDAVSGVRFSGDGLIVAAPSGSTAYNASAGGPILWPTVEGICITPVCPQSLSFRPIVVGPNSCVIATLLRANPGTTLVCDGQESTVVRSGERVLIRRSNSALLLVENPNLRQLDALADKLHWAREPKYR